MYKHITIFSNGEEVLDSIGYEKVFSADEILKILLLFPNSRWKGVKVD